MTRSMLLTVYPGNGFNPPRPAMRALVRGYRGLCPSCGKGRLYAAWMKPHAKCPQCNEALHHASPGAAAALFAIPFAMAIVCLYGWLLELVVEPPLWAEVAICEAIGLHLVLAALPRIKGALIALEWACWMGGFDPRPGTILCAPAGSRMQVAVAQKESEGMRPGEAIPVA